MSEVSTEANSSASDRWDVLFGLTLSIFAAVLAINELGGGKFGGDEIQLGNEKTKSYNWYQSKSIKESLTKGQVELLEVLGESGSIAPDKVAAMDTLKVKLKEEVSRYKKEKDEILRGSKAVGPDNWAQDIDGQLGRVIGAQEIETQQEKLGESGDKFDLATLFLQISLVLGAIGLIAKNPKVRYYFLAGLISLGLTGSFFCVWAYRLAFAATGG